MSRQADITYVPKARDLSDAMFWPDEPSKEEKEILVKILNNHIGDE